MVDRVLFQKQIWKISASNLFYYKNVSVNKLKNRVVCD